MFHLDYDKQPSLDIPYSPDINLPISYAITSPHEISQQVNLTILDKNDQNLTGSQKLLLEWHY